MKIKRTRKGTAGASLFFITAPSAAPNPQINVPLDGLCHDASICCSTRSAINRSDSQGFPHMIPLVSALAVLLLTSLAEWLHVRRIRVVGRLAFGPGGAPGAWTRVVPFLRPLCLAAFT